MLLADVEQRGGLPAVLQVLYQIPSVRVLHWVSHGKLCPVVRITALHDVMSPITHAVFFIYYRAVEVYTKCVENPTMLEFFKVSWKSIVENCMLAQIVTQFVQYLLQCINITFNVPSGY